MKQIDTHKVTSSQIAEIGWSNDTLRVVFARGGVYDYSDVSEELYRKFENADSIGSFFYKNIKGNPKHPFAKVK